MPVATIDDDDELQVGASSEGDEHCLGCGALMPRDSTLAFCQKLDACAAGHCASCRAALTPPLGTTYHY